jgi:hypothetical protein
MYAAATPPRNAPRQIPGTTDGEVRAGFRRVRDEITRWIDATYG